ncbi:MAG TPA: GNAT family N-acetyltransferase [Alphaproteobacteria bacterium]|nr:GNAT family N-acetyltransferase [Alphaproteobacteria bacterium]
MTIAYAVEDRLDWREMLDLFERSGLAERRPHDEPARLEKMARHANLIVTARDATGTLVGLSRALTDFSFCVYLSDLAVDRALQRQGVGKELIRRTHEAAGRECMLILLSAPAAMDYYPKIGLEKSERCFVINRAAPRG